jgi:RNA polymerase sigma factor (sigma-70 family)
LKIATASLVDDYPTADWRTFIQFFKNHHDGRNEVAAPAIFLGQPQSASVSSMMGPEILGKLVDGHARALVLYARQWCAAPEDVVQEAFVKLVAQNPAPVQIVPWLNRVVRNAAISAARAEQRRRRHESAAAERSQSWFENSDEAAIDAQSAAQALKTLPLEEREVITLRLWGGLTFEEIGQVAGCSSSTAQRWYVAGLESLRERLHVHVRTSS